MERLELLRLFPEIRTEGGKIDFERLKLALGEAVDVGKERYGMTWPGKAECFRTIQLPSLGTLRPAPEESVNFETTENVSGMRSRFVKDIDGNPEFVVDLERQLPPRFEFFASGSTIASFAVRRGYLRPSRARINPRIRLRGWLRGRAGNSGRRRAPI